MLLSLSTIAVLSLIIYEDFRYRLVRVVFYVLMFVLLFLQQIEKKILEVVFFDWLMNVGYLFILTVVVTLYFYIRYRTINIGRFIGFGDVLFLGAIALWFEPIHFVFFNTFSFLVAFLLHFLLQKTKIYNNQETVPLAGMQSLCFIPMFVHMIYFN